MTTSPRSADAHGSCTVRLLRAHGQVVSGFTVGLLLSAGRVLTPLAALTALRAQDLSDVFARVSPAVVTIHTVASRLAGDPRRIETEGRIGSGVLLDKDGVILTAAHVLAQADTIAVTFTDGSTHAAELVADEPLADLALLRIRGTLPAGATPCVLGDSDAVRIGHRVFAIGAPLGMGQTLTAGYVSARRQEEGFLASMRSVEHLQTDAAINPGNSGGPLFNLRGEVVGIVCHVAASSLGTEGLGFAVTSKAVREILLDRRHTWLGFDSVVLDQPLATAINVPDRRGAALVQRVVRSSPAHRAGLRAGTVPARIGDRDLLLGGDVVLAILGKPLGTRPEFEEAMRAVRALPPGATLRLSVFRGGSVLELSTPLSDR